jgi:hypothetical protein
MANSIRSLLFAVRPPAVKNRPAPRIAAAPLAPGLRRAVAIRESLRCDEGGRQLRRPASKIDLKSNQSESKERLKATDPNEQQGARHDWIHGPSPRG